MNTAIKQLFAAATLLALSACSGTYNSYIDTLQLAFSTPEDAQLTLQQVREARSDLLYVRHGERSVAAMALLRLEGGQHKWVSADSALLIMQQGRIVRTVGFTNDLLYLSNIQGDQIRQPEAINPAIEWLRLADWQNGEYGYALSSRFSVASVEVMTFFGHSLNTTRITEQVTYTSPANYLRLDTRWQNDFWFDTNTGTLIKSTQQLAPFGERFDMTYISRIARLVPAGQEGSDE